MSRGWLGYSKTGLFYGLYYPTAGCAVNDIQPPVAAVIVTLPIVAESNSAFFFDVAPLPPSSFGFGLSGPTRSLLPVRHLPLLKLLQLKTSPELLAVAAALEN
jgi:hypothetical protein